MNLKVTEVGIHKIHNSLWSREGIDNSELMLYPDKIIIRLDYSLIFSNADLLEELVQEKISHHENEFNVKTKVLVLNCGGVNYVDLSGLEALQNLKKVLAKNNIQLMFMLVKDVVFEEFKNAKILDDLKYMHGFEELKKELDNLN
jgi:MFS superfamily sulfate permease-like transporter